MFIPERENYTDMSPEEFEKYTLQLLKESIKGLEKVHFEHNIFVNTFDGTYQIDGIIRYNLFGCNYITLVECKKYNGPIKREALQVLHDKVRSIGAHKGIFVTTSYYQSGAYDYAKAHGIALLTIIDGKLNYEIRSQGEIEDYMYPLSLPKYVTIMQEKTSENTTSCKVVDDTEYVREFLIRDEC
ncbi:restriction endonuclease [Lacrimispora sp.]|uniref:restriction endonuclease n=1 Tax=Lacrimispora sp. TaxID=2719234 RepID=UPI00289C127E|nr:restriction endonuclease [Lacrimispora sp.]